MMKISGKSKTFGALGYRDCCGNYVEEMDMEDEKLGIYANQKSIQRLPVPVLEETCQKYLKSVHPLLTEEEFQSTTTAVNDFLAPGGMGEKLQARLLARKDSLPNSSWLIEWWNKWAYLEVRDPVVVNVSYFFHLADGPLPIHRSQAVRAATLLRPLLIFQHLTASGMLKPNVSRKTPLDMTAYKYVFNACRIPKRGQDCYRISDPFTNTHICVVRNNKFYKIETLDANGRIVTETLLAQKFQDIIDKAGSMESPIGVLTSWNRDDWADAREQLLQDGNEQALRVIESAICLVCLDSFSVMSREQMAKNLWHGDGRNRFYDKSIQLVVAENGAAGLLMEHSMADGFPATHYADFMLRMERSSASKKELPRVPTVGAGRVSKIGFNIGKNTLDNIAHAQTAFDDLVARHDVRVLAFQGFGSDQIKKLKLSPDAFCQMAIQLAYYKMTGNFVPTYEPAMMLPFLHGRTETIRSVSSSSKKFCVEFVESNLQDAGTLARLSDLLQQACQQHAQYTRDAASGKGIDRHLLGLRFLLKPGETASIFDDPAYAKTSRWAISTSTLSNELFDGWGWGEVVPDGIGVAYTLKKKSLQFNVASRTDILTHLYQPQSMCHLLEESLLQMRAVAESSLTVNSKL